LGAREAKINDAINLKSNITSEKSYRYFVAGMSLSHYSRCDAL